MITSLYFVVYFVDGSGQMFPWNDQQILYGACTRQGGEPLHGAVAEKK
jgi:hypothetical protein